jgi:hypothetical protein
MEDRPKSFWSFILFTFISVQGASIDLLVVLSVGVFYYFIKDTHCPREILLIAWVVGWIFILTPLVASYKLFGLVQKRLPNVLTTKTLPNRTGALDFICLLEPSELFSHGNLVSFYYDEDSYERIIGIGQVINIQENGIIQVIMSQQVEGHEGVISQLKIANTDTLKKVKIKPTIPVVDLMLPGLAGE